jgi:preprotein translocase subunit SecE
MGKQKAVASGSFVGELFQTGFYKRSQGRVARQATFGAIVTIVSLGALSWMNHFIDGSSALRYAVPGAMVIVGLWLGFRLINYPPFADFLIAVGAEMNKVSWPSRAELVRASIVVIFVIFALAALLYAYDFIWLTLFKAIGVIRVSG